MTKNLHKHSIDSIYLTLKNLKYSDPPAAHPDYLRIKSLLATALATLYCLLLASCATLNQTPKIAEPDWSMNAKIQVKTLDNKRQNAIIQWQTKDSATKVNAYNSFSQPLFSLYSDKKGAKLEAADGTERSAHNLDALMLDALGWSLPTKHLHTWLLGRLAGGETNVHYDQSDLSTFDFEHFKVKLSQYQFFGSTRLPSRVTLTHPDFSVLLIVKSYEYSP